jgi:hypothetical protein
VPTFLALDRPRRAGWSVGASGTTTRWVVSDTNGKNLIYAEGTPGRTWALRSRKPLSRPFRGPVYILATLRREAGVADGELRWVTRPHLAEALESLGWVQ